MAAKARTPPAVYRGSASLAWELFRSAPVARVASMTAEGTPLLRAMHVVVAPVRAGGSPALCFHSGSVGEKIGCLGQDAVIAVEEHVATLPSYFFDSQRACPATTYYRSAMAWGRVELVVDPVAKANVLTALMQEHQPEAGHVPIAPEHELYAAALRKITVARLVPTRVEARIKLGQNKPREVMERVLEGLWGRGAPGDLEALELIRAAFPEPLQPDFLQLGDLVISVAPRDALGAVGLVADEYWNTEVDRDLLVQSHLQSPAWVMASDAEGAVATARAICDAKNVWIYDVAVRADRRSEGIGAALMRLLLDHPRVRRAHRVFLGTRDAQTFYAKLGFEAVSSPHTTMVRFQDCEKVSKKRSAS